MDPLFRCIYPDCNELSVLSIKKFCSACGRLCRCPHDDCGSVLDSESLPICPKCHREIQLNPTPLPPLSKLKSNQATCFISDDPNHTDPFASLSLTSGSFTPGHTEPNHSLSQTVGSLTPGHADENHSLSQTRGSLTPHRNDANHAPTVFRVSPQSLTDSNHAPTVSRVSPQSLTDPNDHDPQRTALSPSQREIDHDDLADSLGQISRFILKEEIGRGAFGAVYKAFDHRLKRDVAIKLLQKFSSEDSLEARRFQREAQVAADLRHPNLVPVYESGIEQGQAFIVMGYFHGGTLKKYLQIDSESDSESRCQLLPLATVAQIVREIAEGLAYAHSKKVIHRDIKPANILLDKKEHGSSQGSSTSPEIKPLIADFGLAYQESATRATQAGGFAGTIAYIAPEQINSKESFASDQYSLGVIFYEMLTGVLPFTGTAKVVLHAHEHLLPPPLQSLRPEIPADYQAVCLKCLEKDPKDRYGNCYQLAEDLRRLEMGEPTLARPLTRTQKFQRWVKKNPVIASLSGSIALLMLITAIVTSFLTIRANQAAKEAQEQARLLFQANKATEKQLGISQDNLRNVYYTRMIGLHEGDYDPAEILGWLEDPKIFPEDKRDLAWNFYANYYHRRLPKPLEGHTDGITCLMLSRDGKMIVTGSMDKTARIWNVATGQLRFVLKGHTDGISCLTLSSDGKTLVTGSGLTFSRDRQSGSGDKSVRIKPGSLDNTVRIWDVATGQQRFVLKGHTGAIFCLTLSSDGKTLVTGSYDNTARIWDVGTGQERTVLKGHTSWISCLTLSSDGKTLITGSGAAFHPESTPGPSDDHTARIWDVATGQQRAVLKGHRSGISCLTLSSDGKMVITGSAGNTARIWDVATGQQRFVLKGHMGPISCLTLSSDGKKIITGSWDNTARIWDVATGQERAVLKGHTGWIECITLSSDGKTLFTGSSDKTARIWDVATGQERAVLKGHTFPISCLTLSSDGKTLFTGSGVITSRLSNNLIIPSSWGDTTVRIWDVATEQQRATLNASPGYLQISCLTLSSDGKTLFTTGSYDNTARIWDVATGQERAVLKGHTDGINCLTLSSDGKMIITGSNDNTARIWDVATGQQRAVLKGHTDQINCLTLSSDGKMIVTGAGDSDGFDRKSGSRDNTARIWDAATGQQRAVLKGHTSWIRCLTLSGDGKTLITGSWDNTARIWDVATGKELAVLKGHTGGISCLTLSSDGKMIITGSFDNTARIWDVATGQQRTVLKGHPAPIRCLTLSSDGKSLITGAWLDPTAIIWDVATGKELAVLKGHTDEITCLTLSSDGNSLITGSRDKTARIWDLATGQQRAVLKGHMGAIDLLTLSSDGKTLITGSYDSTVCIWDLSPRPKEIGFSSPVANK